ncbi:MAG: MASE1 domain-containing protein, partial [Pseudomonadota bacterium]
MRPAYRPAWIHRVTIVIVLAVLWHVSWRLAEFGGVTGHASLWYPPAGLTLALALVLRARAGLLVVATVALGSMLSGGWQAIASDAWPWPEALAITAGLGVAHAAPALLGAAVIRRASGASWRLGTFNGTLAFLATVPVVAAFAAAGGLLIVVAIGDLEPANAVDIFVPWLIGDMVGAYTLAPALAVVLARPLARSLGPAVTPTLRKLPAESLRTSWLLALLPLGVIAAALPGLQPALLGFPGL